MEQTHDRSGQPDKHEVHREIKTLNTDNELIRERIEEDMDFKIPRLLHSVVKQLQSASVRELIQKIENHPNRHGLQRDPQQSQSFNPFSQESKQMIHEVGNIELCELLDTEPKTQCKVCFIILGHWHRLLHVRALLAKRNRGYKKFVQYTMDILCIPDYFSKKGRPTRAPLREEAMGQRILRRPFTQEEVQQEELLGHPPPIHTRRKVQQEHD